MSQAIPLLAKWGGFLYSNSRLCSRTKGGAHWHILSSSKPQSQPSLVASTIQTEIYLNHRSSNSQWSEPLDLTKGNRQKIFMSGIITRWLRSIISTVFFNLMKRAIFQFVRYIIISRCMRGTAGIAKPNDAMPAPTTYSSPLMGLSIDNTSTPAASPVIFNMSLSTLASSL